jgi:glycosyltransferase involved in cell wall biosynthesis
MAGAAAMTAQGGVRPVRVALDVTPAEAAIGGVARYTRQLWRHLELERSVEVHALQVGWRPPRLAGARRVRAPMRLVHELWRRARFPTAERIVGDIDVVHSIDLVAPPTRKPLLVTMHDVIGLTHPELFATADLPRTDIVTRQAKRATAVVATCESTADDIASVLELDRASMIVAPPGLSSFPPASARRPIDEPYVLAVGAISPRKGYDVLAEAAAILGADCPRIVIAGQDYWRADDVRAAIDRLDRHSRVQVIGAVDDAALSTLYAHAALLCHPSRAEGFGFPCLEAMAFGVPVAATDLPSIREMTAGQAAFAPVGDPDALAHAITELLTDEQRRARVIAAGIERAATYTWTRTASILAAAYHRITERTST